MSSVTLTKEQPMPHTNIVSSDEENNLNYTATFHMDRVAIELRERYATWLKERIVNRDDAYVVYPRRIKVEQAVSDTVLYNHACGSQPIAVYAIARDNTCKWVCWDID